MAWDTKYIIEFKDHHGLDWWINIEDKTANAGSPTIIEATGEPLIIKHLSTSDFMIDNPICGSMAEINVYSSSNWQWNTFYQFGNLTWRVSIYYSDDIGVSDVLYWQGYLISDEYQEPYDEVTYPVKLIASDGLGQMKDFEYLDASGNYFDERLREADVILNCLAKVGITEIREYVNVFEDTMDMTADDSALHQATINADLFRDMNCYDVVVAILQTYNACLRQIGGIGYIYRPFDLNQSIVTGRRMYITGLTYKYAISLPVATDSIEPNQVFLKEGVSSDLLYVNGGTMRIRPPVKKVTLTQDYRNKESWLDNWQLTAESWDGTDFDDWTQTEENCAEPISNYVKGETDGIILIKGSGDDDYVISQEIGEYIVDSDTDVFVFEFEYGLYNFHSAAYTGVTQVRVVQDDTYYLADTAGKVLAEWSASETDIEISESTPVGWSGWKTFKRQIVGTENGGTITVELHVSPTNVIYSCFKNIRFYATSYSVEKRMIQTKFQMIISSNKFLRNLFWGLNYKGQSAYYMQETNNVVENEYSVVNDIYGINVDINYILGDVITVSDPVRTSDVNIENVLEQFAGSIGVRIGATTSNSFEWTATFGESNLPLLEIIGNEIASQAATPKQLLTLPVQELNEISDLPQVNILGNFMDYLNLDEDDNVRKFVFNGGEFDVKERIWNLELMEINLPEALT